MFVVWRIFLVSQFNNEPMYTAERDGKLLKTHFEWNSFTTLFYRILFERSTRRCVHYFNQSYKMAVNYRYLMVKFFFFSSLNFALGCVNMTCDIIRQFVTHSVLHINCSNFSLLCFAYPPSKNSYECMRLKNISNNNNNKNKETNPLYLQLCKHPLNLWQINQSQYRIIFYSYFAFTSSKSSGKALMDVNMVYNNIGNLE